MPPDKNQELLREARLLAIDWLLMLVLARQLADADSAEEEADRLMALAEKTMEGFVYPEADAAESDAISQEMRDALVRRVVRARAIATGETFDPVAFQRQQP